MSTPGGWGANPYGQPSNDPNSGEPPQAGGNPPGQGAPGEGSPGAASGMSPSPGMQYQGFGSFQQPPSAQQPPSPGGFPAQQPSPGGFQAQPGGFQAQPDGSQPSGGFSAQQPSTPGGFPAQPTGSEPSGGFPAQPGGFQAQPGFQQPGGFQQPPSAPEGFPAQQQPGSFQQPGGFQQPSPQQPGSFQHPSSPQQPGFQQQPKPSRGSRGSLVAAIAISAVAVIAIATTIVVLVVNSGGNQAAPVPPAPVPTSKPPATTSSEPPAPPVSGPPVVPGWQAVAVPRRSALYDAPLEWWVDNPDNTHGFGSIDDPVTMSGVSIFQPGFCREDTSSFRAIAGATARKGPDDAAVATETAQKLVQLAYTVDGKPPQAQFSPPTPVQIHGGRTAMEVNATVTHPAPGACDSPTVHVTILATNSDGQGSVVFISVADQGIPGAITPDTLHRMAGTMRPAG
ncbi:hypothetical protein [Saccharopolyspora taberi]|uniref:DUF8017 domain-containing protein n=1 Tax=Saccharopolyspora taberi TaxID=60895 RepID=A0ABN3V7J4_9PSEU